jgi:hypothetical protein
MCATLRLKHQAVLAAIVADVVKPKAVIPVTVVVAMVIPSTQTPRAVVGAPAAVIAAPAAANSVTVATITVSLLLLLLN